MQKTNWEKDVTYEFAKEYGLLIGGQWVPAEGGETFETTNPATAEVLARCANASANDVQKAVDFKQAEKLAKKIKSGEKFDLEDFKAQISQMKNMGGFSGLVDKLPAQLQEAAGKVDDKQAEKTLRRTEGIINSMTPKERRNPDLIKASRKRRIAAGAGVTVQEVNRYR